MGSAADLLASYLWRETALGVPSGVEDARLVLDQLTLAQKKVLACLMGVGLIKVRNHKVVVVLMQTEAQGFIAAQLSRCLCVKIQSFLPGMHQRTGDSWGLWVMRTRTRGGGATEGLGGTVVVKLGAGGFFSR